MSTPERKLKRITTEYAAAEDRIRISGEAEDMTVVVVWLTQRLLTGLLPVLTDWVARSAIDAPRADVVQGFEQGAARAALVPQPPVRSAEPAEAWLAVAADIGRVRATVQLRLRAADARSATVTLTKKQLRQWLSILHRSWTGAGWPRTVWPDWIQNQDAGSQPAAPTRH